MTSVSMKQIRELIRKEMDAKNQVFSVGEIADSILLEQLELIGVSVKDLARQVLVVEIEKLRKALSSPPSSEQPTLPGFGSIGAMQLFSLGKSESVWAGDAKYEHAKSHLDYVEQNRKKVDAAHDALERDLVDSGALDYLERNPEKTLREAGANLMGIAI